jgi:hypothetical protein
VILTFAVPAAAQVTNRPAAAAQKWEILDNSFLVEEAFNQEAGVVQNILTWTRGRGGRWDGSFTQEWPAPGMAHQISYTLPFSGTGRATGIGDALLNYRFQLREETARGPSIAPRVSIILPTGREEAGLGAGTAGLQINVPASKQFGDFYLHANAGYTWLPDVQAIPQISGSGIWRVTAALNLMLEGTVAFDELLTVSPGFRRGWNFGDHQLVIGVAVPITWADGGSTAALLTYFSYELPFR